MLYDTATGDISELDCEYRNGCTVISRVLYDYDSLLLRLDNGRRQGKSATKPASLPEKEIRLPAFVPYTLSERNALLLDTAEFSLDGAPFKPEEEILRLDNICRRSLGFPERGNSVAQRGSSTRPPPSTLCACASRFAVRSTSAAPSWRLRTQNPPLSPLTAKKSQII